MTTGELLPLISATGADVVGVDWRVPLDAARDRVGPGKALQGNLDPAVLHARPAVIREHVRDVLARFGDGPGHVFNLGHGVTPDIKPDHVAALVDAVHEFSAR